MVWIRALAILFLVLGMKAFTMDPPGTRIDLGGYALHFLQKGEGGPPVILIHGEGDNALIWSLVIPEVSTFTRVVALDEPGMGWSDYGPINNTLRQKAFDFHQVLKKAQIQPPFILVGHSKGGLIVQEMVRRFPEEVAGVVLLDSSHVNFMLRYRQPDQSFKWQKVRSRATGTPIPEIQTMIEKGREFRHFPMQRNVTSITAQFPEKERALFHWLYNREGSVPVGLKSHFSNELQWMYDHPVSFGDIPLVVVSAGKRSYQGDEQWNEADLIRETESLQKDLLNLSTLSRQLIVEDSGHRIQIEKPQVVITVIRDLYNKIRGH